MTLIKQIKENDDELVGNEEFVSKLPLIRYIISTLIYGGKIMNEQDDLVLQELLETVVNRKII